MNDVPRYAITPVAGCDEAVGRWLGALADTRLRTVAALREASPFDLDAEPAVGRNTIGTILYHLAATDLIWGYERVLKTTLPAELDAEFPTTALDENGRLYRPGGLTLEEYEHRLDLARRHVFEIFLPMTPDALRTPFRCTAEFGTFEATPEAVLNHLMQHEAEHRAQVTLLAATQKGAEFGS